jgi:hypothetical protein
MHENDWTTEGYMIQDDEGFLQWNAQQAMENNYPEAYVDDYHCILHTLWKMAREGTKTMART